MDIKILKFGKKEDIEKECGSAVKHNKFTLYSFDENDEIIFDSLGFPQWVVDMASEEDLKKIDWEKVKEHFNFDVYGGYTRILIPQGLAEGFMVYENVNTKERVYLPYNELPFKHYTIKAVYHYPEAVSEADDCLNEQYEQDYDMMICHPIVSERIELLRILDEYVDEPNKEKYIKNILDKFIEGEHIAVFGF